MDTESCRRYAITEYWNRDSGGLVSPHMTRFPAALAFALVLVPLPIPCQIVASDVCSPLQMQALARQWAQQHDFAGAVLVERSNQPLVEMAFGEADREHHAANAIDTPFRIGSITKLLTAAAILRQIADGRVQPNTPVCTLLADCPASWRPVTVEHALTHSDGLPDIVRQPGFAALATQPTTPEETLSRLHNVPQLFLPGAKVAYGNTGMIALSAALEKLTGTNYSAAIDMLVLRPAGLDHTAYDDSAAILPGRAHGYVFKDGKPRNAPYIDMTIPSGAGGLVSTVRDLDRFTRAFLSGALVPLPLVHEALTPKNAGYGLGWAIRTSSGVVEISHIGDINGFGSFLAYYPGADTVSVVLSNVERTPVSDFARLLAQQCDAATSNGRPE